ncbi:MAG: STAS domain-containing protein [Pseudodesulfovibrio sp.]|uniref:Sulfate transporter/antisigma-factor antagonist STAS n=1 Tax=Pseudodesulfovibrio aespoeensis (strain ATCC 700646 / DSM 10631 / Aspo-2) TaxID=643562 RepID=E6VRS8_PSEA9|nr:MULTISPECIES: STAS domain-containing protein [Pseudodesulfovibrio]MBU4474558.1 STAS domain-containing protein [Pseudomonadota bacterium]ADU64215.1 Sulfate transporter/antisigma-factor antagonist STAS [Pseudodesulfovibrio aespoeensis Aspo-2]MBU4516392.1 STAS domain-containing protein [Pseudomonadota bacterium]MBU4523039.1 STAS domain-containing protein [Pseudomonadota bacterium]MBU4558005.1 STAS domain-containing protein [Pseudomonadota bacterium]
MEERMVGKTMILRPVEERLDAANSGLLKSRFVDLVNDGHRSFVIDLSAVDFMDSTGLAALMSGLKTLGGDGEILLASLSVKVRKLFALTRLDQGVFRIFASTEEALAALGGKGS